MLQEIWVPVKKYEEFYEVSNLGRVRSKDRVVEIKKTSSKGVDFIQKKPFPGKLLKPQISDSGYYRVGLHNNGKNKKLFFVSNIVAEAFIQEDYKQCGLVCDHINEDKLDNRLSNLQIISKSKNTHRSADGEKQVISAVGDKFLVFKYIDGVRLKIGEFNTFKEAAEFFTEYLKNNDHSHYSRPKCKE